MNHQSYTSYVWEHYGLSSEGPLTDFVSRRNGHLYLSDRVNLNDLARRYDTPLEVACYPQITRQVQQMYAWAASGQRKTRYAGRFIYAYATKANFAAEVVQTALDAGAHYETSAAADVEIARHLWRKGILPADRLVCCNGSKEPAYLDSIRKLREDGCANMVTIIDDLEELDELRSFPMPLQFGVRERLKGPYAEGLCPGNDRFGLTFEEMERAATRMAQHGHHLVLYHAMVGSQVEDSDHFLAKLYDSVVAYCQLRQRVPTLRYFNFGGGIPASGYRLDFHFDYARFLVRLMEQIQHVCAAFEVPVPDLIGEFGRYTVANHSAYLFKVGRVKAGQYNEPAWYLVDGSLMVSMPDMVLVKDQQFAILPLYGWDAAVRPVRLAGRRTCDSDDVYPRPSREPLMLPDTGQGLVVAVFGVGAYQQMISGLGGAHHCLTPEPRRIGIKEVDGSMVACTTPPQDQASIMRMLGYQPEHMMMPMPRFERKLAS